MCKKLQKVFPGFSISICLCANSRFGVGPLLMLDSELTIPATCGMSSSLSILVSGKMLFLIIHPDYKLVKAFFWILPVLIFGCFTATPLGDSWLDVCPPLLDSLPDWLYLGGVLAQIILHGHVRGQNGRWVPGLIQNMFPFQISLWVFDTFCTINFLVTNTAQVLPDTDCAIVGLVLSSNIIPGLNRASFIEVIGTLKNAQLIFDFLRFQTVFF